MAKRAINGAGTVYREHARWRGLVEIEGEQHEVDAPTRRECAAEAERLAEGRSSAKVMSITKVGRDRWVGQIFVVGKRRKVTGGTRVEVEAKLEALRGHRRRGEAVPDGNATFDDLSTRWRRMRAGIGRAQATAENDDWALGLLEREFGAVRLRSLNVARVEEGMGHIADGAYGRRDSNGELLPLSKLSARRILAMLRRVLDYAERLELIGRNPAMRLDTATFGRARDSTTVALTAVEAAKLYEAAGEHWIGNYVRLGLVIGARPSELAALCWDAVDLDGGRLEIRRSRRKVGPGRYEVVDALKTSRSRRMIDLPSFAVEMLHEQRAKILEAQLAAASWPQTELMFPSPTGTLLDASNVRRDLKRICEAADVPVVGPNALRHSVASLLAYEGESPARVAQLLGHSTPATTWRYYTHAVQESAGAAAGMGGMLGQ
ncbi:MAG: site-specific integrase [Acidimicrobiia bacterium]|nr:site-specific integrase [Acidimicrobiia bacterium]